MQAPNPSRIEKWHNADTVETLGNSDATAHSSDSIGSLGGGDRDYRRAKRDPSLNSVHDLSVSCLTVRRSVEFLCGTGNARHRSIAKHTHYAQKTVALVVLN